MGAIKHEAQVLLHPACSCCVRTCTEHCTRSTTQQHTAHSPFTDSHAHNTDVSPSPTLTPSPALDLHHHGSKTHKTAPLLPI
jgi:hypothetical protein